MNTLNFDKNATLEEVLEAVKKTTDEKITLIIDSQSPLVTNHLNFRILEKMASSLGKEIKLEEVIPSGETVVVKESDMEDNLGFVEEGEESPTTPAPETIEEVAAEMPPQQSETLQLDDAPPTHAVPNFAPNSAVEPLEPPIVEEAKVAKGFLPFNLPKFGFKIPNLTKMRWQKRQLLFGGIGMGVLLLVIGSVWFLPSADVKLYVSSQSLDKEATISATPRLNEIDLGSNSIPLTQIEARQSGSLSTKVYGKKTIGDPAHGKVTLRNYSTSTDQNLNKGSIITVVGKSPAIQFSLDRAVTIPSGSASSSFDSSGRKVSVIDPGRLDVEATAAKIGTDGNISSNTRLSVSNQGLDVLDAVANGDFSGGTSKEVTVVSQNDRANLLATLSAQLTDKAKGDLQGKLSDGQKLPDGGIETQVVNKTFSKDVDAEAQDLNLNLEIIAKGNIFNEKDLGKLLVESLKNDTPSGFKVSESETTATAEVLKINDDKTLTLLGKIKAKLIPDLNIDEVAGNIKGKNIDQAKEYLKNLNNINDLEITLKPQFLSFLKSFPRNQKRIKIEIITRQ